jgi:integrase
MASGHIERLKTGYRVVVYAGKDPITGRKVYLKETHSTEAAAAAARARLLAQVEADTTPDRAATVATLMQRWTETVDHELTTSDTVAGYIRRTILPALGDMPVRKLQYRVDILDRLYSHLRRCRALCPGTPTVDHKLPGDHDCASAGCAPHVCKPMAPATIRQIHSILSSALGYAVSWGWIEKNPAEYAHPPKAPRPRAKPPQADQVARLLNLAWQTSSELAVFLWLATTTGARRGELTGLRWDAVDLRSGFVEIRQNYVVCAGQRRLKATKTDTDRRLALDSITIAILSDYRDQRNAILAPIGVALDPDAFVFSSDPACLRPWNPSHFTHAYRELADVLGITQPLKNLRHFNATQLLAAGVDLRTTAGRLGHADGGATTLRVYADWLPATDLKAATHLAADLEALRGAQAAKKTTTNDEPAGPNTDALTRTALPRVDRPIDELLDPPPASTVTYVQVAEVVLAAINSGRLQPGDLIPPIVRLGAWFSVAPSTAHRALTRLASDGHVVKREHRWTVAG